MTIVGDGVVRAADAAGEQDEFVDKSHQLVDA